MIPTTLLSWPPPTPGRDSIFATFVPTRLAQAVEDMILAEYGLVPTARQEARAVPLDPGGIRWMNAESVVMELPGCTVSCDLDKVPVMLSGLREAGENLLQRTVQVEGRDVEIVFIIGHYTTAAIPADDLPALLKALAGHADRGAAAWAAEKAKLAGVLGISAKGDPS